MTSEVMEELAAVKAIASKAWVQGPKLPCSCWLHTLPRLRAS